ncbi:MAG: hypothetical protein AB9873_20035 [Syntrophobacteraceae bacterium]
MKHGTRLGSTLTAAGLLLLLLTVASGPVGRHAHALIGDSEEAIGLNGSIRTLFFLLDQDGTYPFSARNTVDALSQTILRLTLAGRPTQWLAYEIHWVQTLTASTVELSGGSPLSFGSGSISPATRYRVLGGGWNVLEDDQVLSTSLFDRFNAKFSSGWGDVTLGRQAITFGKTYFWNPLDVFFPFDSTQFDRDYKPGVDALRVDIPLGRFSGINLVGSAGPEIPVGPSGARNDPKDASWYGSAILGRAFSNVGGWDLSLQGGKIYGGYHLGAGVVGDVGPIQVRAEAAQFLPMRATPLPAPLEGELFWSHFLGVLGLGHRFENGLTLDFEYFYNGAGDPNDLNSALVRTQFGASLQMSRHLAGMVAQYEFTPLVTGRLAAISSLSDASTQLQPIVTFSLSDEMDLLVGLMLNFGPPPEQSSGASVNVQSEFGTLPTIFFTEWKLYF